MEKTYKDYTVRVDDGNMRFHVKASKNSEHGVWFNSYAEATEWIDKQAVKERALARAKIALPVIREDGELVVLTGIHARSQALLTKPPFEGSSYASPNYYPHAYWIVERLREIKETSERLKKLRESLTPFMIDKQSIERKARASYEDGLDAMKADHATKHAAAQSKEKVS